MWRRACLDTCNFFGWNKKSLSLIALWVVGAVVYYFWQGREAVMEEVFRSIAFGLIPVGAFAILLFIWNMLAELKIHEGLTKRFKLVKIEVYSAVVSTQQQGGKYPIEMKLIFKIRKPPRQLAESKLCLKSETFKYDSISPNLSLSPIRLTDNVNHITAKYEVPSGNWNRALTRNQEDKIECRYHIKALISGEQYISDEYIFDNPPHL